MGVTALCVSVLYGTGCATQGGSVHQRIGDGLERATSVGKEVANRVEGVGEKYGIEKDPLGGVRVPSPLHKVPVVGNFFERNKGRVVVTDVDADLGMHMPELKGGSVAVRWEW